MKLDKDNDKKVRVLVIPVNKDGKSRVGTKSFTVYDSTVDQIYKVCRRALERAQ